MSAKAVQRLARLREEHVIDHDGREAAGKQLLDEFITTCEQAGLNVVNVGGQYHVSLWHPPVVKVEVSHGSGDILIGRGSSAKVLETGLVYDPVNKVFVTRDPESTDDAVDILTDRVARVLKERSDKYRESTKPKVDQDYEDALDEATHPYR